MFASGIKNGARILFVSIVAGTVSKTQSYCKVITTQSPSTGLNTGNHVIGPFSTILPSYSHPAISSVVVSQIK